MIVEGDLQIKGTTTTISSSNTTFQDSILGLGITGSDAGTESFNNLGDRGLIFARGANQTDALPGMWWDGSKFNFAKSITSPSSGSFGTVTDRSTVRTGDVEAEDVVATSVDASSVTASLGLRVGNATDGYELPATDGLDGQVLQTDGSGNLTFANQSTGQNSLLVKKIAVTGDPIMSNQLVQQTESLSDKSPDIIYLDYSGRDTTSANYIPTNGNMNFYTIRLHNVNAADFAKPQREFYLGISGFNHDHQVKNAGNYTGLGIRIVFAENPPLGLRRTAANSANGIGVNGDGYNNWTIIQKGFNLQTPMTLDSELAMAFGHDFQFTAGEKARNFGGTQLLERCVTDSDKIYCIKFTWIKTTPNGGLQLKANYDNIEIFSVNDTRFSEY